MRALSSATKFLHKFLDASFAKLINDGVWDHDDAADGSKDPSADGLDLPTVQLIRDGWSQALSASISTTHPLPPSPPRHLRAGAVGWCPPARHVMHHARGAFAGKQLAEVLDYESSASSLKPRIPEKQRYATPTTEGNLWPPSPLSSAQLSRYPPVRA